MKISGAHPIPAAPERAYAALQDPAILAKSMPGCERLEQTGEDEYRMVLKMAIASIAGQFDGRIWITDKNPPEGFTLNVEGKGKPGFVKGSGALRVLENGTGAEVRYDGEVQVGGTIAAVGQRLIDTTARLMIKRFFDKLAEQLAAGG